jgi:hypothetical protein
LFHKLIICLINLLILQFTENILFGENLYEKTLNRLYGS